MLIKGNPEQYELMVKTQMESICVGVEICSPANMMQATTALPRLHPCPTTNSDRVGSIHYLVNPKIPRVSGLAELMSAKKLQLHHPRHEKNALDASICMKCMGLGDLLA